MSVRIFSRGRELHSGDWFLDARREFARLDPDTPHERVHPTGAAMRCVQCSAWCLGMWVVRCGECERRTYPRLTLFWSCDQCGGPMFAQDQLGEHVSADHPMLGDVTLTG